MGLPRDAWNELTPIKNCKCYFGYIESHFDKYNELLQCTKLLTLIIYKKYLTDITINQK